MPQPTPVWFLWSDDQLLIRSQPHQAKIRDARHHPEAAVHLNSTPSGGDVVVLTGILAVDDAGLSDGELTRYDDKYVDDMRGIGMTPEQFHASYSVTLRFTPTRLRSV